MPVLRDRVSRQKRFGNAQIHSREKGKTMRMKLFGKRDKPVKYISDRTRFFSADVYLGGAQFNEVNDTPMPLPIDEVRNLEHKFNSGVNRTDVPRMWGHPSVDRHLAGRQLELANEVRDWRRNKGEPLWKK